MRPGGLVAGSASDHCPRLQIQVLSSFWAPPKSTTCAAEGSSATAKPMPEMGPRLIGVGAALGVGGGCGAGLGGRCAAEIAIPARAAAAMTPARPAAGLKRFSHPGKRPDRRPCRPSSHSARAQWCSDRVDHHIPSGHTPVLRLTPLLAQALVAY